MSDHVVVRPARLEDVSGIMEVERESWGEVGEDAMAEEDLMRDRVLLCNKANPAWFWVVEARGRIEGHAITQPTSLPPEECTSWEHATDAGTLKRTFDPWGSYVYGVTLAVRQKDPLSVTADLLVLASHSARLATGRRILYLCARMSGYAEEHALRNVSAEDYWQETRPDGSPRDPFLHHFAALIGVRPVRLLRNGFPPDAESGGHGVLCMNDDPVESIYVVTRRLARAGFFKKG